MERKPKKVRMQEIADRAGVSRMTVSLAMRNHPRIPRATRARIRRIAREAGYRPNPLISALMIDLRASRDGSKTLPLAFVTAFPTSDHWQEIDLYRDYYRGAADRAASQGFRLDHFWLSDPKQRPEHLVRVLRSRAIPGLLVAPVPQPGEVLPIDWEHFASVTLGYSLGGPQLHRACSHHAQMMFTALRELSRLGYRRIGLCTTVTDDKRVNHNWIAPYLYHYYEAFEEEHPPIAVLDPWTREKFMEWYLATRPEAVIATRACVLDWLREAGVRIPEETGVALVDASAVKEPCAGIDQRGYAVGVAAMDMLTGQLYRNERGIPDLPRTNLLEGRWVDGPTVRQVRRSASP